MSSPKTPLSPTTLVLWDIDLTLVDLRGLGGRWYDTALRAVAGVPLRHTPSFPGRTERSISAEVLRQHGVPPTDDLVEAMFAHLVASADAERPDLAGSGHALPGVTEALDALAGRDDVAQSLVTGNLPRVAEHKVAAFGLDRHLDLAIGGYGDLSEVRADLVAAAKRNAAAKFGHEPARVVVVGDTPADVAAALAHRAVAVGVATGRHSAAELLDAGADVVFDDLADTGRVLREFAPC